MSKKRLFQVLDEMNVNDEKNKTTLLPCAFTMVEAKSDKRGGLITMGVEAYIIQKIFLGEMQPILVVMDKTEYHWLDSIPLDDQLQAAEQRAERYEKALFEIQFKATSAIFPHLPVETLGAQMCIEIEKVATEALTSKTGSDE